MSEIKIIEQNINQNKKTIGKEYVDKLDNENFYNSIKEENADIYIFNEVIEPQNIINKLEELCPNKYEYKFNKKDLTYNSGRMTQNKIMILYDKRRFTCIDSNEDLYSIEDGLDFLHIKLKSNDSDNEYNIIGVRFHNIVDSYNYNQYINHPKNYSKRELNNLLGKIHESNKKPMTTLQKLMEYVAALENVVITGDFNNGGFKSTGYYQCYKYYNYHTIYNFINSIEGNKYKLLTAGVKEDGGKLEYDEACWTHLIICDDRLLGKIPYGSPIDHYIISNSLKYKDIKIIEDSGIENYAYEVHDFKDIRKGVEWGRPDHRKVVLVIEDNS